MSNSSNPSDTEDWLPLEKKNVPIKSDFLKTKSVKSSKKKVGNYYSIVFRILFNHSETFQNLTTVSKSSKQTLDISKGLMITELLQRVRDYCGLSYRPDEKPVYDVLNKMKYQKKPFVEEYALSKGRAKNKPHYFLTEYGFTTYSLYRNLELTGKMRDFIKGIEES